MGRVASFVMGVFAVTVVAATLVVPRLLGSAGDGRTAGLSVNASAPPPTSVLARPLPAPRQKHRLAAARGPAAGASTSHPGFLPRSPGTEPALRTAAASHAAASSPQPTAQPVSVTSKPVSHRDVKKRQ